MSAAQAAIKPTVALVVAIKQSTSIRELKTIQAHIVRAGLAHDTFLTGKLMESAALTQKGHIAYAHGIFSQTHHPNVLMWNTLIRGYSLSDSPIKAVSLYRDMHLGGISPNSFSFRFVLKACCKLLRLCEGEQLYAQILKLGFESEPDVVNVLLKLLAVCGRIEDASKMFDEMPQRNKGSWSAIVSGYAQNDCSSEALSLFRQMLEEGVEVDGFTLASVVGVCGDISALDLGKWLHSYIDREGIELDVVLGTSLVVMYSKCGSLDDALKVFEGMRERDVTAWSAMIGGYAIHGYGKKALQVFDAMKRAKVKPNCVTFTSVLCACSHAGLIEEGSRYFDAMALEYGISPQMEHYGCMVDLYCRAGLVSRAHEFVQKMPIEPNAALWRTLLTACKTYGYKELGEQISEEILELEPHSGRNYVLVSNVYASLGRWSSVSKVRRLMKDKKAKKEHGCSSIEVDFVVHQFVMGDETHPEIKEIYDMLDGMAKKLKKEGYVATTIDVLHDIDEEEKEQALSLHSERLALAYGLLRLPEDSPIRVVKNLRVCIDCHSVIKLISAAYKREITVRDRVRFHHFREGKCSCNDYW
ncbi:pentatricopeptide repeat-containing protein At5g66520-like [Malania oleifera]|uniref:pentatricopeptide repeat-containing protein At5g66520-like n=1 Tax=Malania oleifera TaxID=397392 RepID=UPI0025AE9E0E|nr:pentatricopeptide repeat-containing protein At5g66520-like [Malania oleifera]